VFYIYLKLKQCISHSFSPAYPRPAGLNLQVWEEGIYGQFGKKFAEKVPGEVLQLPAPGADTETLV
jgi:hypothetical protein